MRTIKRQAIRNMQSLNVGDTIVAGETEEEREDGTIMKIDGERALIAWRQGTSTWIYLANCEAASISH